MSSDLFSYAFQGDWAVAEATVTAAVKEMLRGIQGEEPDTLLLEYVLVMVGNKKTIEEISKELNDFLSENEVMELCRQLGNYLMTNFSNTSKVTKSPARAAPAQKKVAVVKSQVIKPVSVPVPTAAAPVSTSKKDIKIESNVSKVAPTVLSKESIVSKAPTEPQTGGITLVDLRKRRMENIKGEIVVSTTSPVSTNSKRQKHNTVDPVTESDDAQHEPTGEDDQEEADASGGQFDGYQPYYDGTQGWGGYDPSFRGGRVGGRGFRGRFSGPPVGGRGRGRDAYFYPPVYPFDPSMYPPGYAFPPYYPPVPFAPRPFAPFQRGGGEFQGRGRGRGRGRGDESVDAAFEAYTSKRTQNSTSSDAIADATNDSSAIEPTEAAAPPTSVPTAPADSSTGSGRGFDGRGRGRGRSYMGRGRGAIPKPANKTWVRDVSADGDAPVTEVSADSSEAAETGPDQSETVGNMTTQQQQSVPYPTRAPRPFIPRPYVSHPVAPRGLVSNKKWVRESDMESALTSGR